jgi:colanic acid biosynthesis glycosyl transferase WcaI
LARLAAEAVAGQHLMRVVLIHRYFWPDTPPYAHILRAIALRLGEAGHDVTVLTCQPSYDPSVMRAPASERLTPNVEIRRWPVLPDRTSAPLKVVNLVWFCMRVLLSRRSLGKVDVVMAASTPPLAVAKVGALLALRSRARFVYHNQDIYPEVVTGSGILRNGRRASLLRRVDSRTDRAADRVVVLSDDMADTIAARGVVPSRIVVINNFDPWPDPETTDSDDTNADLAAADGALTVVFAGNLGRFQNLETVIDAIALLGDSPIEFHFFGTGALAPYLSERVAAQRLRHVHLHGYRPPAEVGAFLRTTADIGIVSLMPGVIRAAFPSKTMSYLRQGCPVLVLVEADSSLARMIEDSGAGFHSDPVDPEAASQVLRRLAGGRTELAGAGKRAADLYEEQFSPALQLDRWMRMFAELDDRDAA